MCFCSRRNPISPFGRKRCGIPSGVAPCRKSKTRGKSTDQRRTAATAEIRRLYPRVMPRPSTSTNASNRGMCATSDLIGPGSPGCVMVDRPSAGAAGRLPSEKGSQQGPIGLAAPRYGSNVLLTGMSIERARGASRLVPPFLPAQTRWRSASAQLDGSGMSGRGPTHALPAHAVRCTGACRAR